MLHSSQSEADDKWCHTRSAMHCAHHLATTVKLFPLLPAQSLNLTPASVICQRVFKNNSKLITPVRAPTMHDATCNASDHTVGWQRNNLALIPGADTTLLLLIMAQQ